MNMGNKVWSKRAQAAHRRKWIAALESGEFKQTKGRLHNARSGGFCCLGVACEISGLGKWDKRANFVTREQVSYEELPYVVQSWLGLAKPLGGFNSNSLANINDEGKRFKTIARIIRENEAALTGEA